MYQTCTSEAQETARQVPITGGQPYSKTQPTEYSVLSIIAYTYHRNQMYTEHSYQKFSHPKHPHYRNPLPAFGQPIQIRHLLNGGGSLLQSVDVSRVLQLCRNCIFADYFSLFFYLIALLFGYRKSRIHYLTRKRG